MMLVNLYKTTLLLFASFGILCTASAQQNNILQLHPLNAHYFLYQNKPLVLVGSGEHYGAVMNTTFNYNTYLATLQKDGLNTTRLFMGAYYEKPGAFGIERNTLAPAEPLLPWKQVNGKYNLEQWNDAYFTRLHHFMQKAAEHGVIVEINLFSSYYGAGWAYHPFNGNNNSNGTPANLKPQLVNTLQNGPILKHQEAYVRRLVKELNRYGNLYFEIQNEPWADATDTVLVRSEYSGDDWRSTIQVVSQQSNNWQRQVAQWIKNEESSLPNQHLISQNISNFYYPVTQPDPNISIFNFHYTLPEAVHGNYHLNKAIGFNETGFAGKADNTYRRQAWRFLMAGGSLFNHLDYSFWPGSETGSDTAFKAPGGGSPALRKQLGILKQFFEQLNFIQLKPDNTTVLSSPGASTATLSDGGSQWVIYYEPMAIEAQPLRLNLPAGQYLAEWIDVTTGNSLGKQTISNTEIMAPNPPGDKVLLIKPVEKK